MTTMNLANNLPGYFSLSFVVTANDNYRRISARTRDISDVEKALRTMEEAIEASNFKCARSAYRYLRSRLALLLPMPEFDSCLSAAARIAATRIAEIRLDNARLIEMYGRAYV